ncbi:E3 ubiquitin-protein ligase ORTHRUS 2 [Morella rubra]|uniref:E3 ubiquitin-protein ligase ORTHRUS 2 n=1 Tax=Morella rubra TaxID=262757 RepID=A0A6A1VK93_9ROSI|nr:E3 ubiquitin-protein ligase ORTHRUS 2 [Morella rubra]
MREALGEGNFCFDGDEGMNPKKKERIDGDNDVLGSRILCKILTTVASEMEKSFGSNSLFVFLYTDNLVDVGKEADKIFMPCGHDFCLKCFQKWIGQDKCTCANYRNKIQANMISQPPINSVLIMANRLVLEENEEKIAPGTLLIELSSGDVCSVSIRQQLQYVGKKLVGAQHYNKDGSVNNRFPALLLAGPSDGKEWKIFGAYWRVDFGSNESPILHAPTLKVTHLDIIVFMGEPTRG